MIINIFNLSIPLLLLIGLIYLVIFKLYIFFTISNKDIRKEIGTLLTNTLFLGFISWKLTPIFTNYKTVIQNPSSLLFLQGGVLGEKVAFIVIALYIVIQFIRNKLKYKYYVSLYILLCFLSLLIVNSVDVNKLSMDYIESFEKLTILDEDFEVTQINTTKSKTVILNFWATWCPPCKAEIPSLNKFYNEYKNKVDFYGINMLQTEKDDPSIFIEDYNITFPIYYDKGVLSDYFKIESIPTTIIIYTKNSKTYIYRHTGVISEDTLIKYALKTF
ncbi:TlpA family protein disulfide reductase [Thiospirochaeta perfilievii]|uniref:TlpA family protein disulfide reductase n=1 Tax=Thiospirochaeta perfilievii TaxID=252967 RepID=A0A5C1QDX5_9SPIO|nr:TlpA disulfide reductase family protein [Thiospirochaeta perfilievii]QEN06275.1 TlpA family protein disulfide reductase [Thiospirochaeta perfilievii]